MESKKNLFSERIDALKGISVLAVMIYHAKYNFFGVDFFKGGFLGVDIFFLISGYLITLSLLTNSNHGQILLKKFYIGRAKRILPLLFIVIIFTSFFSFIVLLPDALENFFESSLSANLFFSNFFFYFDGQEYGAVSGTLKPLLHTWSLSVEMQFYLVYPILLLILFKYFNKFIFEIFLLIILASFFINAYLFFKYNHFNFYFTISRLWEFFLGGILALRIYYHRNFLRNISSSKKFFLVNASLLGIFLCFVFFERVDKNFSLIFHFLTILFSFIILNFIFEDLGSNYLLNNKLLIFLGSMSYSLYMWHYPIFSIFQNYSELNDSIRTSILFITFLISYFSFFFIENFFRNKKYENLKLILFFSIIFTFLNYLVFFTVIKHEGFKNRFSSLYSFYKPNEVDNQKLLLSASNNYKNKKFEYQDGKKLVLIIGDSYSGDLYNLFDMNSELFKNYQFIRLEIFLDYFLDNKTSKRFNLTETKKNISSEFFNLADIILISYRFEEYELKLLKKLIEFIKSKNQKKIILFSKKVEFEILDKPLRTQFDIYYLNKFYKNESITDKDKFNINKLFYDKIKKNYRDDHELINLKLKKISIENDLGYIETEKYTCIDIKKICHGITDDGYKIYSDYAHYTLEGAKFFGKKLFNNKIFY